MWGLLIEAGIWAAFYVINRWVIPKPGATPPRTDNLELPRSKAGAPVPLVFGRCLVESPLIAYTSNSVTRTDYGLDASGNVTNSGVAYFLNMFFVVGVPMGYDLTNVTPPLLHSWRVDSKFASWSDFGGAFIMNRPLSGGMQDLIFPILGRISFYDGRKMLANQAKSVGDPGTGALVDQVLNDNDPTHANFTLIADAVAHDIAYSNTSGGTFDLTVFPSFRNYLTVAITGVKTSLDGQYPDQLNPGIIRTSPGVGENEGLWNAYLGPTAQLPAISFEVSSFGDGTISAPGAFGDDADPMQALYDLLTNPFGKLGVPIAKVDLASFRAASAVLLAEGHGFSRVVYDRDDASSVIASIMQQVDGSLFIDPVTGLFTVKLVRNDYNVALIPAFTDAAANIVEITDYGLGAWRDTFNRVEVSYTERVFSSGFAQDPTHLFADYVPATAVASNMANAVGQDGNVRLSTIEMPGVTNPILAAKIAARELNVVAQPLSKLTIVVTRDAIAMRPGDPFLVTYSEYGINAVFRVTKIDFGQYFDNKVVINAIQDVWDNAYVGWPLTGTFNWVMPWPMRHRFLTEAPYWLQYHAYTQGTVGDAASQRLLGFGVPDWDSNQIRWRSRKILSPFLYAQVEDVPVQQPSYATLAADYSRVLEPYDTTTGMQVTDANGPWFLANALVAGFSGGTTIVTSTTDITNEGAGLVCVVRDDGQHEFMAFETNTMVGASGSLTKVWRGLLDTPAIDHFAGERVYLVDVAKSIGASAWTTVGRQLEVQALPSGGPAFQVGSGDDPIEDLTIHVRSAMPAPAGDMSLSFSSAPFAAGTIGTPGTAGSFKRVTVFDEGAQPFAKDRSGLATTVTKSSSGDDVTGLGYQYEIAARKATGDNATTTYSTPDSVVSVVTANASHSFMMLGPQGHGEIDVAIRSVIAGGGRFGPSPTHTFLTAPTVRVTAPRWRNLLANPRFTDSDNTADKRWTFTGNPLFFAGASGLTRASDAPYMTGNVGNPSNVSTQTVNVLGYLPRGMNALLRFYVKTFFGKTTDTFMASLTAFDSTMTLLSTASVGPLTASTTAWTLTGVALASLPANTRYLQVVTTQTAVTGTQPGVALTECSLTLGDYIENVLTNGFFNAGAFTGWTNSTNSFVANTAIPLSGSQCAQGGPFATSEIRQTYTVPVGREFGTARLRFYRATTIAGDQGQVFLEALDAGGATLAGTSTSSVTTTPINVWFHQNLTLDMPAGTVSLRVRLQASRAAGAGNSGACFADAILSLHKYLDGSVVHALDFSHVTTQQTPTDWQQSYLAFTALTQPQSAFVVFDGDAASVKNLCAWSDGLAHASAQCFGWWSDDVQSIGGYAFTGSAYLAATSSARTRLLNPTPTSGFTFAVLFRYDQPDSVISSCGIAGRQDGASGWSCGINSGGHFYAQVRGASGVATSTCTDIVTDGAWHLLVFELSTGSSYVRAGTERGPTATASTVTIGDFTNTSLATPFRLGGGSTFDGILTGTIARAWGFPSGVGIATVVAAVWNYGKNPTSETLTLASGQTWVALPPDQAGNERLATAATDQWPLTYLAALPGTHVGLASQVDTTNLWQTFDFTSGAWSLDASATKATGVVDQTGRPWGATLGVDATNGAWITCTTSPSGSTSHVTFWARANTGLSNLVVELRNASGVVKSTSGSLILGATWKRFDVDFAGWDLSTAACQVRFRATGGITFDLGSVACFHDGSATPAFVAFPASLSDANTGGTTAAPTVTGVAMTNQFNAEGEVVVVGACAAVDTDATDGVTSVALVTVDDSVTTHNRREVYLDVGSAPKFAHANATGTNVTSAATAVLANQAFTIRGRWCAAKTLDATANAYAGVVVTGSANSSAYGRTATFTYDAVPSTYRIFRGHVATNIGNLAVQSVTVRTREQKLV